MAAGDAADAAERVWATLDQRRRIFELLARRSGLSIPDSEDAVSEAFVRVVRFRHLDQEQLYSFTVMVVRNLSIDILRRKSRERTAATRLAALTTPMSDEVDHGADEFARSLLRLAAEVLAPTELRVFCLAFDGYPHAAIADRLGVTVRASEVALSRARRKLRAALDGDEDNT